MKKRVVTLMILALVLVLTACNSETKKPGFDSEKIKNEILTKYNELNGLVDNAKVDLWDTYFLNHPGIGNTHNDHTNIGWETFHNAIIKDKSLPNNERLYAESYDITVYPINESTAWVKGKIKMIFPDKKISNNYFYDSLIKTKDGWRVFNSVVNSISD